MTSVLLLSLRPQVESAFPSAFSFPQIFTESSKFHMSSSECVKTMITMKQWRSIWESAEMPCYASSDFGLVLTAPFFSGKLSGHPSKRD